MGADGIGLHETVSDSGSEPVSVPRMANVVRP